MTRMGWIIVGAAAAALLAVGVRAAEDDLTVVKRAVASAPASSEAPAKAAPPAGKKASEPQWLKVRVAEKGAKKGRVSINLPLSLVRALGDDCPIAGHGAKVGKHGELRSIRLSQVLQALESGGNIVEIDDDEATVRVWME